MQIIAQFKKNSFVWDGGRDGGAPKEGFQGKVAAQLNFERCELKMKQRRRLRAFQAQGTACKGTA